MNRRQHSFLYVVWVGCMLLVSACGVRKLPALWQAADGPPREPLDLTILHTGQVYGEILPCG